MTDSTVQMIGLGELLWDCFPDRRLPGGAPANVAFHAQQLGMTASVVSRVGADEFGAEIKEFLVSQGLNTTFVQPDPIHPTGTVTIWNDSSSGNQYRFLENSAWDFLECTPDLLEAVRSCGAICFGTLAQRRPASRATIQRCLQTAAATCQIIYDVNLRPPFVVKEWILRSMERATVVKLNEEEVQVLVTMFDQPGMDEIRFAKSLLDRYRQLQLVCITKGGHGCVGVSCEETLELPGISIDVFDTVGAGDAFTGAVVYGRTQGWSLGKVLDLANRYGALVASRPGAMPVLTDEVVKLKAEIEWAYRDTPKP